MKGAVLVVGEVEVNGGRLIELARERGMRIDFVERIHESIDEISERLFSLSNSGYDSVFTIGGTGIGEKDVVPEATEMIIDKRIPGLEYFIFKELVESAKMGFMTRLVAGIRRGTIIVNLPSNGYEKVFPKLVEALVSVRGGEDGL